jgi:hypothetical protein
MVTEASSIRQRAEELLAKITPPGTWAANFAHPAVWVEIDDCGLSGPTVCELHGGDVSFNDRKRDAEFIAAAPQLVRDLLALLAVSSQKGSEQKQEKD